jgi:hypothetical protein
VLSVAVVEHLGSIDVFRVTPASEACQRWYYLRELARFVCGLEPLEVFNEVRMEKEPLRLLREFLDELYSAASSLQRASLKMYDFQQKHMNRVESLLIMAIGNFSQDFLKMSQVEKPSRSNSVVVRIASFILEERSSTLIPDTTELAVSPPTRRHTESSPQLYTNLREVQQARRRSRPLRSRRKTQPRPEELPKKDEERNSAGNQPSPNVACRKFGLVSFIECTPAQVHIFHDGDVVLILVPCSQVVKDFLLSAVSAGIKLSFCALGTEPGRKSQEDVSQLTSCGMSLIACDLVQWCTPEELIHPTVNTTLFDGAEFASFVFPSLIDQLHAKPKCRNLIIDVV